MNFHDHALAYFQAHAVFFATVFNLIGVAAGILLRQGYVAIRAKEIIDTQAAQMDLLSGLLATQASELTEARQQLDEQTQKVDAIFGTIKIAEQSRDQWRDMYWKTGLGHSNLQAMLSRRIAQLHAKLKRLDGRHNDNEPSDVAIKMAVDAYRSETVDKIPPEERGRIETDLRSNTVATAVSDGVISRPE